MKKYLLGLIAIVGLGVFSAFTINTSVKSKKETRYIFYEVVGGNINTSAPLNDEPMTVDEFESAELVPCEIGNDADCVRGWEEIHTPTTTGAGDAVIKKEL